LSGRGAFVNGHVGNQRFRELAIERKPQFDAGTYADKRTLAADIVGLIRSLDPPGRFLKRVNKASDDQELLITTEGMEGGWEELSDDRATHKACQVMRDLQRPDRTGDKKSRSKAAKAEKDEPKTEEGAAAMDEATVLATAEEVLDKALAEADPVVAMAAASVAPAPEMVADEVMQV